MFLTELVLQGVREFNAPKKLGFKPGLNVLLGGSSSERATLSKSILGLLYPSDPEAQKRAFESIAPSDACRAGISFSEKDQIFRKVVDFKQSVANLSRLNRETAAYESLFQDATQIQSFLMQDIKLCPEEIYRILLFSCDEEFPSKNHVSISQSALRATPGTQSPEALKRELMSLRKLHDDAMKIKNLQYALDGLQKEIFEAQDILKRAEGLDEKLVASRKEQKELGTLPDLPDDLEARTDAFDHLAKKRDAEVPQMEQELQELREQKNMTQPLPLEKDSQFLMGCGFLVIGIIVAIMLPGREMIFGLSSKIAGFISMLLAGIGMAVGGIQFFKFLSDKEKFESLDREIRQKSEKLKTYVKKFEVETTIVRNIFKILSVDSTTEMFSLITRIREAMANIQSLEVQLDKEKSNPRYQKAAAMLPQMVEKSKGMERELQTLSATPLDPEHLEDQIRELERQAKASGVQVSFESGAGEQKVSAEFVKQIGEEIFQNPTQRLIAVAAHGLRIARGEFLQKLKAPLDKNLAAFSFKNFGDSHIELDGTFSVVEGEGNTRVRYEQLEPFKQDLAYFALKFTLLQFLIRDFPVPLLFDSLFSNLDARVVPVIAKALKFLGQQTQILFLTDREEYAQAADHLIRL